jgi:hypothetical protein
LTWTRLRERLRAEATKEGSTMLRTVLAHLRAQWMGALALFLVLAGSTAYAANTVFSTDIVDGEVKTADLDQNAVRSNKLATGQVQSIDVKNDGLTGDDIADQSGVDTCTHGSALFGELCVRNDNVERNWTDAINRCAQLGLRLPSLGEAVTLAVNFDIPDFNAELWTDARFTFGGPEHLAYVVNEDGGIFASAIVSNNEETVCVTTPTS